MIPTAFAFEIPASFHTTNITPNIGGSPSLECNMMLSDRRTNLLPLTNKMFLSNESSAVKTVVYPCAGTNSSLPFMLYREAETVYMIDLHPAVSKAIQPSDQISLKFSKPKNFRFVMDIDQDFSNGDFQINSILAELYLYNRNIRIKQVELFSDTQTQDWTFKQDRSEAYAKYSGTEVHALIQFDTGPNTPTRKIVYINSLNTAGDQWWKKAIASDKPEGFVVMGAMQIFNPYASNYNPEFTSWLRNLYDRQRGNMLVEGVDLIPMDAGHFEFTGTSNEGITKVDVPLGYGQRVKINIKR